MYSIDFAFKLEIIKSSKRFWKYLVAGLKSQKMGTHTALEKC